MIDSPQQVKQPFFIILLLILAGEAVFILPFVLARVFRPTFLDVFQLTNLELGTCFSVYGIVAFISYLFGGPLADRFPPRKLMSIALFLTALGGVALSTYPSYFMMKVIYGYWGFTTIFLFWAALIKATRIWGGSNKQGKAFGFLDGGRGLVAALFGTLGVVIFSIFITIDLDQATLIERKEAFRIVILITSLLVALISILVYFKLKLKTNNDDINIEKSFSYKALIDIKFALKTPSVWLLMIIILCAYVGYKFTDDFSLYAKEVMLFDEIKSAKVGAFILFIRPIIGVFIGFMADKTRSSFWLIISFLIMLIGAIFFASGFIVPSFILLFFFTIIITASGTFALRTLYFSAMQEGQIPLAITGTAVGLISLIGYTPDIFVGPSMGYLLDNSPGELGHQHVFLMLSIFSFIGLITSFIFFKISKNQN